MRTDETKSSKGKSRQDLRNNYAVVGSVKKWMSLHGEPLHLSYLNQIGQSTHHGYSPVLHPDTLGNLVVLCIICLFLKNMNF